LCAQRECQRNSRHEQGLVHSSSPLGLMVGDGSAVAPTPIPLHFQCQPYCRVR
jgi:hypothetical protein